MITPKTKSSITIAVCEKEIRGEVVRGAAPTPTILGFTMDEVKANNTAASCWSAIDGFAYNLTNWISFQLDKFSINSVIATARHK